MLFKKEMRLPIDSEISSHTDNIEQNCFDDLVDDSLIKHDSVFENVAKKMEEAQKRQKHMYDRKHICAELSIGIKVMVENSAQKGRKGGKLQEIFRGNYTIAESLGKGLYKLKNEDGKILQKKFNINRLQVYRKRAECDATQNEKESK